MKIAIGNDHVAVEYKLRIQQYLETLGHTVINLGTDLPRAVDYPIPGEAVANAVAHGEAECGILICGTGVGISLAANKVNGIRAVVCSEPYTAKLSKEHNDTNILALGCRVVGVELAEMIIDAWLKARFEGGRHQHRLDLIAEIEQKQKGGK